MMGTLTKIKIRKKGIIWFIIPVHHRRDFGQEFKQELEGRQACLLVHVALPMIKELTVQSKKCDRNHGGANS